MRDKESLIYSSSIQDAADLNPSFAKGKMRIAYHGRNAKGIHIPKETFDAAIPTLFNCPIVAHYDPKKDEIGGHDVVVEKTNKGLVMSNVTEPVGVIPESTSTWWEEVEEDDGVKHEYLCCDILLWKRQRAFAHLLENGVTDESMEIEITGRHYDEQGEMHVDSMEFTAFCLLERDPPCFRSAGIELFSLEACKEQFSLMMEDFRKEFSQVIAASADDIQETSLKGGDCNMNDCVNIDEMLTQYGLSAEDITFETEGMTQEELTLRFSAIRDEKQNEPETQAAENQEPEQVKEPEQEPEPQNFSLTVDQFVQGVCNALRSEKISDPYCGGQMNRYWYMDCDMEAAMVYAEDSQDRCTYGIPYTMNGDLPVLDFSARKRMKRQYVELDEGDTDAAAFSCIDAIGNSCKQKYDALMQEKGELEKFCQETKKAQRDEEVRRVFTAFSDLAGNERFEALKENVGEMTADELEEKCFAIRGRMAIQKYSDDASAATTRLPVEGKQKDASDEPYGGIFAEFGIGQ